MSHTITVRHNFETAHRLPPLEGKCTNLHGHSWDAEIAFTATSLAGPGIVAEYGEIKRVVRDWIDEHLDHGAMLGQDDPLRPLLEDYGKVYVFGRDRFTHSMMWPTVEAVAATLGHMADTLLCDDVLSISWVRVNETAVNAAEWTP